MRSSGGLSGIEAAERLRVDGPNRLPAPRRPSAFRRLGHELVHFFALLLWAAALLALVGGMPQLSVAIAVVVVLNAVFAFAQETRADHAAERLRSLLPTRISVRRDGRATIIDAAEVVRGDVLLLDAGDRVPADATVVSDPGAAGLLVDASLLTGESAAVHLGEGDVLHAGTFLVEGMAEAVVTAIGGDTRLADIAQLTTGTPKHATPLTLGLRAVVRTIAVIAIGVGATFFAVSLLLGNGPAEGFVFAIGVTVALVPEALLPTVTLSLAYGAEKMAGRQVLVRNLEAVETLGSTTFVCTDKTGTLTLNQMTVVEAWAPGGHAAHVVGAGYGPVADVTIDGDEAPLAALASASARSSSGHVRLEHDRWLPHGDPMEAALDAFARRLGCDVDGDRARRPERSRFGFDPHRRRMSVLLDDEVLVKGAPDSVLERCRAHDGAQAVLEAFAERGLRVLAVARRPIDAATSPMSADAAERDLELLGLVGLHDPPRLDVRESMDACRAAGIRIAMITGDHPATAAAIATEVGLRIAGAPVLVGTDLPIDLAALGELVDHDGVVVARVSPEEKLRIAQALRARGHVVAMTGDGVNDAPALHEADIGIAMGASGTDVAREAADLVLLDDHFASIVAGIELGRATYVNIRRFLTYHLTDNVAELLPFVVWVVSGGRFPLALGVLQILALDIGTDTLSAVALGAEPPSRHLLEGPPVGGKLMNHTVLRRAFGLLGPSIALWSMLAFVVSLLAQGWRPGDEFGTTMVAAASGATFITIVLGQSANAFACRSATRRPGQLGWATNPLLFVTTGIEGAFALTVLLVPWFASHLGHASPPLWGWAVAAASIPLVLAVDALDKRHRRRHVTSGPGGPTE
ncbi:MAG: cation-transporting P-type ATPase [Ilumatobacteraceae bacterium]